MDLLNQNKIERKNNKTEHFNILEGSSILFCAKDTQNQDELINSIIFC